MTSLLKRHGRKVFYLWPVLLGLACAYVLSAVVQPVGKSTDARKIRSSVNMGTSGADTSWTGIILQKNIMNLEIPEHNSAPNKDSPAGMDGWRLLGTFTGRHDLALVQVKGENKLLTPGQTVQGFELSAVHPQTVEFKAKGRTCVLHMWPPDPKAGQRPEPTRAQSVEPEPSSRRKVAKKDITQLIHNPNSLLQTARFAPYSQNGEIQGFAVNRIQPGSILDRLGLKNKDVVTRIDGRSIHGPVDLLQAHSSLKQSSLVTLDILRRGTHKSFVVEIR